MATASVTKQSDLPVSSNAGIDAAHAVEPVIKLTFVVAMYGVARYLPEFLKSIENQEKGPYSLQCIFVDDGSPDDSAEIAAKWLASSGQVGALVRKTNGGVSSARNAGIPHATGDWISFPDPDDLLDASYLKRVSKFLRSRKGASAHLVAANVQRYFDETKEVRNTHALRFKFKGSAKNVNLAHSPHYIQLMTNSSFVRLRSLQDFELRFDERLSNSEDAVLLANLLSRYDEPIVGIVPEALYLYRKRSSLDSAVDTSYDTVGGFTDRYRFGYLPLFEKCGCEGLVPEWLANLFIYELNWMFGRERAVSTKAAVFDDSERAEFLDLIRRCLRYIADEWILGYRVTSLALEIRYLLIAIKGSKLPKSPIIVRGLDQQKQLVWLGYYFTGEKPQELFRVRAKPVSPVAGKVRTLDYFGQQIMFERIVWVPANSWINVELDGVRQELRLGNLPVPKYALTEREIWPYFDRSRPVPPQAMPTPSRSMKDSKPTRRRGLVQAWGTWAENLRRKHEMRRSAAKKRRQADHIKRTRERARAPRVVEKYKSAWVLMDRLNMAQDNAEHMYRYLQKHQPHVNAWFVLRRDSRDWDRLKRDGFKLVAYRSPEHVLLMLNAAHMISSHVDIEHTDPIDKAYYPSRRQWRFTFLQHGVTKDDLSGWLNRKGIALFITATKQEYKSIVADGTPYIFTTKEVALTGFPRHDALLGKRAASRSRGNVKLLLVAPTWREFLLEKKVPWEPERTLVGGFEETQYAMEWFGLLESEELASIASASGLQVAFLPHPWLAAHIDQSHLPNHVRLIRYDDGDIQEVLAATAIMVTDYSSLAFEAAYVEAPVVYFQFDEQEMFGGGHTYVKGYFDYRRDGFGPVANTMLAVLDEVRHIAQRGGIVENLYKNRAEMTFAFRDGKSCDRVYEEINRINVAAWIV